MKLVIQIPCLDEAETLPAVLADLPREVPGFDVVEWLVVDDGSRDRTAAVARAHGVDHVVRFPRHRGLARAFCAGLDAALAVGADVIVNTDGDHQYPGRAIPALVRPILEGRADMVVADRGPGRDRRLTWARRQLHRVGSWMVRRAASTEVPDAASGFRALSREAALRCFVHGDFSYTLESLVQAGRRRAAIAAVPVHTNAPRRPSRLFRHAAGYVGRSALTLLRAAAMHRPLRFFFPLAALLLVGAFGLGVRFLVDFAREPEVSRHVQSLILLAVLAMAGVQLALFAFLADLLASQRELAEETLARLRRLEHDARRRPDDVERARAA